MANFHLINIERGLKPCLPGPRKWISGTWVSRLVPRLTNNTDCQRQDFAAGTQKRSDSVMGWRAASPLRGWHLFLRLVQGIQR